MKKPGFCHSAGTIGFLFLFLLLGSFQANAAGQQKLYLLDPLEPVYPDSNSTSTWQPAYAAAFPLGTRADVHVVLQIPADDTFSISAWYNKQPLPLHCWSTLREVPVEENTGLDSRTEQFTRQFNPYVIRRAPFKIYEGIVPLAAARTTASNPYTVLRLSVPCAWFSSTGKKVVQIRVKTSKGELKGTFTPTIYSTALPDLRDSRFFYTNWFSMTDIETRYQLVRWSDDWFAMLGKYAELMASGRQNAITIPGELIYRVQGRITLDEERMIRYINLFRDQGFQWFESPHLMNRGDNDDWGDPELKVALTGERYYTPLGQSQVDTIVRLIKRFTLKYDLTHQWLQHISDEPTNVQAGCYRSIVRQVKSIYPEIKIMEATNARDSLNGSVDLWCPLINDFQENEAFFRSRENEKEKVLVYTCLIPGGPWLNRLLDQERLRQVYFGWGAAHYQTFGYLHWGLNQYQADPWKQSVVHHPAPGAGANNFLPPGDTHVIYPGDQGPLSSTRFEAHRVGIEDYELLMQLQQKNPERARQLIAQLFRSYTDYERSTNTYRSVRQALLEALEK